ncbi:hypothetical protein D910_00662, partial [Dendroctonus ponderosae]
MPEWVPKRYIRDMQDPFQFYGEQEFVQISVSGKKPLSMYLAVPLALSRIGSACGLPIPAHLQLQLALRFYNMLLAVS